MQRDTWISERKGWFLQRHMPNLNRGIIWRWSQQ